MASSDGAAGVGGVPVPEIIYAGALSFLFIYKYI
jgi:hypothetical protein